MPPWPKDLPDAYRSSSGAICLPDTLGQVVADRLLALEQYPVYCQSAINTYSDYLKKKHKRGLDEAVAAGDLALLEEKASSGDRLPTWVVIIMTSAALSAGAVVGFFVGQAVK